MYAVDAIRIRPLDGICSPELVVNMLQIVHALANSIQVTAWGVVLLTVCCFAQSASLFGQG